MKRIVLNRFTYINRGIVFSLCLVSVLSTLSCVTTQLPEPGENCKSALVICTDIESSGGFRRFSYIELAVKNYEPTIDIIPSNRYILITNLNPETYTTTAITILPQIEGGFSMKGRRPEPIHLKVQFTMEPGKITFFPVQFIYVYEESSVGVNIMWRVEEITPEVRVRKTQLLRKNKSFSSWKIR
jgi:hypothetical protein